MSFMLKQYPQKLIAKVNEKEVPVTEEEKSRISKEHDRIKDCFKTILKEWAEELAKRPEEVKKSEEGKAVTKSCQQCADNLKSFFKLCQKRRVPYDIRVNLLKVVDALDRNQFIEATKYYLLITIGNAPWPIGVTATGIYERCSRERIQQDKLNVGHAMQNEQSRLYLTMLKRLMTYKEKRYEEQQKKELV